MNNPLDLVFGARQHLLDLLIADEVSFQVVRSDPKDCPSGKIRWAIEIKEPVGSSKSIPDKCPRVLQVYDENLQTLYGICLEQAGCKVESAPDTDVAMRMYCEYGPYDVVLTDLIHFIELFNRIRQENLEQKIAILGSCGATGLRLRYKVPILREGFRRQQLVKLVESAIKPEVRILLVAGECGDDLWDFVVGCPTSFEIELESNGDEALKSYRERGPYDMVVTGFQHQGMDGSDLALAIRRENPTQRIALITEKSSPAMRRSVQRKLGDIPVLQVESVCRARNELWKTKIGKWAALPEREAQTWLDSVERATIKTKRNKTTKKPRKARGRR